MKNCINCGRSSFGLLCFRCRRKVPSDFNKRAAPDELLSEIKKYEHLKELFKADRTLGNLSVDTVNKIFHIGKDYYRFSDLRKYSFFVSEPRFPYGLNRNNVYEDIYFAYTLRGSYEGHGRRTRKLQTVSCQYTNTGRYVSVEPPVAMIGMKQLFAQMVEDERNDLRSALSQLGFDIKPE